jgi:hypothetical protein
MIDHIAIRGSGISIRNRSRNPRKTREPMTIRGRIRSYAALLVVISSWHAAEAQPGQILIIRHAEKPADDNDIHLSAIGKKRADALPSLFQKSGDRSDPLPKPNCIFATKQSRRSNRPFETVAPLAAALKLKINDQFDNEATATLAAELLSNRAYAGKTILICWHHGHIPDLARRLNAADVPEKWKDTDFESLWLLSYAEKGKAKLTKKHEGLLPGDEKDR